MAQTTHYVTLGIERELFAVPVARVREILDRRDVALLPFAPACLLGIIDVRGQAVPVIDLRVKLGLPPVPATASTRILVLEVTVGGRDLLLGLVAERVFEVTELDGGRLDPPPEAGVAWRPEGVLGVGRRNGAFVIVLDPTRLFADDDISPQTIPAQTIPAQTMPAQATPALSEAAA